MTRRKRLWMPLARAVQGLSCGVSRPVGQPAGPSAAHEAICMEASESLQADCVASKRQGSDGEITETRSVLPSSATVALNQPPT